ncbi:MAG TPA: SUMF1/EgtB/PvdO family nonheme iron enzyme, partial [Anaerolineae bacterium]|nr:SUMF1/EgtB/PvdO family nonheme iron enzyme [Anaerolineae bacterium]
SICGVYNLPDKTFRCRQCGRSSLCLRHQNPLTFLCCQCSPVVEATHSGPASLKPGWMWLGIAGSGLLLLWLAYRAPSSEIVRWHTPTSSPSTARLTTSLLSTALPLDTPVLLQDTATRTSVPPSTATHTPTSSVAVTSRATPVSVTPTAAPLGPRAGDTMVLEKSGVPMVYVPSGTFIMGSSDAEIDEALALCNEYHGKCEHWQFDDESPQRSVVLEAFWIGRTEVTMGQYDSFMREGGYQAREWWSDEGWAWKSATGASQPEFWGMPIINRTNRPVLGVSWYEAEAFARWAGARLPTEAEWEKAARGTDGRLFPWGDHWNPTLLNYCDKRCGAEWRDAASDDGWLGAATVGSYPLGSSAYGALDMSGNAVEWVNDWYDAYPGNSFRGGEYDATFRVLRGGSFYSAPPSVRCSARMAEDPEARLNTIGFRVAK